MIEEQLEAILEKADSVVLNPVGGILLFLFKRDDDCREAYYRFMDYRKGSDKFYLHVDVNNDDSSTFFLHSENNNVIVARRKTIRFPDDQKPDWSRIIGNLGLMLNLLDREMLPLKNLILTFGSLEHQIQGLDYGLPYTNQNNEREQIELVLINKLTFKRVAD